MATFRRVITIATDATPRAPAPAIPRAPIPAQPAPHAVVNHFLTRHGLAIAIVAVAATLIGLILGLGIGLARGSSERTPTFASLRAHVRVDASLFFTGVNSSVLRAQPATLTDLRTAIAATASVPDDTVTINGIVDVTRSSSDVRRLQAGPRAIIGTRVDFSIIVFNSPDTDTVNVTYVEGIAAALQRPPTASVALQAYFTTYGPALGVNISALSVQNIVTVIVSASGTVSPSSPSAYVTFPPALTPSLNATPSTTVSSSTTSSIASFSVSSTASFSASSTASSSASSTASSSAKGTDTSTASTSSSTSGTVSPTRSATAASSVSVTSMPRNVSTLAGGGFAGGTASGQADGVGTAATFTNPYAVALDGNGTAYIADYNNNRIRQLVISTGAVTTIAGNGTSGRTDGVGTAALFQRPISIALDGAGRMFVSDSNNNVIRSISIASATVSTLVGSTTAGFTDGVGMAARFNRPYGIVSDGVGGLYVADSGNSLIRYITIATAAVISLAGNAAAPAFLDATGTQARFNLPAGLFFSGGILYVADNGNNRIRQLNATTRVVTTVAGAGSSLSVDGIGTASQFWAPNGITGDEAGNLFVSDTGSGRIRGIVLSTSRVSTLAGSVPSFADGFGTAARFNAPAGLAFSGGQVYVADSGNNLVRVMR